MGPPLCSFCTVPAGLKLLMKREILWGSVAVDGPHRGRRSSLGTTEGPQLVVMFDSFVRDQSLVWVRSMVTLTKIKPR
ncbi:MAG: hypothetical protein KC416_06795 [Myxococcales bacterium]|nr:hypothetical protein [Myxococcales bacterium]